MLHPANKAEAWFFASALGRNANPPHPSIHIFFWIIGPSCRLIRAITLPIGGAKLPSIAVGDIGKCALGNMFQFNRDFSEAFCGARSLETSRDINPGLMTLGAWLAENRGRIPL